MRNGAVPRSSSTLPLTPCSRIFCVVLSGFCPTKSLQFNILRLNYLFSIFYRQSCGAIECNYNGMNSLRQSEGKHRPLEFPAKSLFWNILEVNSLVSIFYAPKQGPSSHNPHKINTLRNHDENGVRAMQTRSSGQGAPRIQNSPSISICMYTTIAAALATRPVARVNSA